MSRAYFSRRARNDLNGIYDYIADDNPAAAESLIARIKLACAKLADFPEIGQLREDLAEHLRLFPVGSYAICFRPKGKGIEIVRIVHGARDYSRIFRRGG